MIDARGGYNLQVYGGDGDDTILLTPNGGYAQHGTYFGVSGGAGDDLIIVEAATENTVMDPLKLTGGEGQDDFELTFDETIETTRTYEDYDDEDYSVEKTVTHAVRISYFQPGSETVQLNLELDDPSYEVASATLTERYYSITSPSGSEEREVTELLIRYESPTEDPREIIVEIDALGVTWDDITFVGDNVPSVLVPV